jgi:hypothetical protein
MLKIILAFLILSGFPLVANADILITESERMELVDFDGKWSFEYEWKPTSRNELKTDDGTIYIRTAHYGNFIYVLLDVIPDKTFSKGMDKSIICFENRDESIQEENNYCFSAILNISTGKTFQNGGISVLNSNYKLIKNPEEFIGIGGISDENDRYSKTPHVTYEYKIPIDFFGRSNVYGFYLYILDHDSQKIYTWPAKILDENEKIPPTEKWGEIISPDKTLPEFHLGVILLISMMPVVLIRHLKI